MASKHIHIHGLPSLRKLSHLRVIGQTPIHLRFTQDLITQWMPLINKLVSTYDMRGRLDKEDLIQELVQQIWRLTSRIDPVSQPDDFRRMCKTELRNKCVDLSRFLKAQKRMGRLGKAIQCKVCGGVTPRPIGSPAECAFCGPDAPYSEVDLLSRDVNIEASHRDRPDSFTASGNESGEDNLIVIEMIKQVREYLLFHFTQLSVDLLDVLIDPDERLFKLMDDRNITSDHRSMVLSVYAAYFETNDRDISSRMKAIREAVRHVCGDDLGNSIITRLSPKSI